MELKISNRLALIATVLYIDFVTAQASARHRIAPPHTITYKSGEVKEGVPGGC